MSNNQHYTLIDNKFIIGNFENEKYDDFFFGSRDIQTVNFDRCVHCCDF